MVNCNPETVSTDYDTSDRLYFEPLTLEDVLEIVEVEKPGGGDRPVRRADAAAAGAAARRRTACRSWERRPIRIDLAEDRAALRRAAARAGDPRPRVGDGARPLDEAQRDRARGSAIPLLVRPSYVLGGRAMFVMLRRGLRSTATMRRAVEASPEHPVLLDRFLEDAFEVDVDALCDGADVVIAAIMQHIEEAGIHSGDSACVLPPYHPAVARQDGRDPRDHAPAWRSALDVPGPDERPVRDQGRGGLRPRGQPAGVAARCRSSPRPPAFRWRRSRPS